MTSAATSTTGEALLECMLKSAVSAASGSSACPTITKFSESVLSSLLIDVRSDAASLLSRPPLTKLLLLVDTWSGAGGLRVGLLTGTATLLLGTAREDLLRNRISHSVVLVFDLSSRYFEAPNFRSLGADSIG